MTKKYAYKGTNSDYTACEVCGRQDLSKVMWLIELDADGNESGEAFAAGTTCGAKLLGYSQKDFNKATRNAAVALENKKSWALASHPLYKKAEADRKALRNRLNIREYRNSPEFAEITKVMNEVRQEVYSQEFSIEL